jgi:hypothetical protein
MGGDHPSERRRDDEVGSRGAEAAGGGGHTPEQAAITDMAPGGREERRQRWGEAGEPGRSPPVPGGASGGHSDRKSSRDGDETVAAGHSKSEREAG